MGWRKKETIAREDKEAIGRERGGEEIQNAKKIRNRRNGKIIVKEVIG